jgi:outer membrane protein assembly factor BamB
MNVTDRDALIRSALTPPPDVWAPPDLGAAIHAAIAATPQRPARLGGRLGGRSLRLPILPVRLGWAVVLMLLTLALIAVLGVATRPAPALRPSVVTYHGGPGQTGEMPGPGPIGSPRILWTEQARGQFSSVAMVLVHDGTVFALDSSGTISAFDADSGVLRWRGGGYGSAQGTPALESGVLVIATDDGTVAGLDPATGRERWTASLGAATAASVAASGGRLFLGAEDGSVHVLDALTGLARGSIAAGGPVQRSPAIAANQVIVAASGGRLTSADAGTLATTWTMELGAGEVATPAISDGTVYAARGPLDQSAPYEVVAVGAGDGRIVWRWTAPSDDRLFLGAVSAATVFILSEDGTIQAIDRATGAGRPFFVGDGAYGSLASFAGHELYVSSPDGTVRAIDLATGVERWSIDVAGFASTPVVVGGRVYVGTKLGQVIAIGGAADPTASAAR